MGRFSVHFRSFTFNFTQVKIKEIAYEVKDLSISIGFQI